MSDPHRPTTTQLFARGLTVRCPRCGSRGVLRSWFKMQERCPRCGLALERGESHDYWLGGMMFNIVLAEFAAVFIAVAVVLMTWPNVPWGTVWVAAMVLAVVAPVLMYPLSRTLWLAFDLALRPGHESHLR